MGRRCEIAWESIGVLGELVARVTLADDTDVLVVVTDGVFAWEFPAPAIRLTLTDLAPSPELPRGQPLPALPAQAPRRSVDIGELSDRGVAVPADGRLALRVLWLAPCDGEPAATGTLPGEGTRFGSYEHTMCAALVGQAADQSELEVDGIRAGFTGETALPVGDKALRFGEIIALAGDFYAHLDDRARDEFAWAWAAAPSGAKGWLIGDYRSTTLAGDEAVSVDVIRRHIFKEEGGFFDRVSNLLDNVVGKYPTQRYLALASQNPCHFACQTGTYGDVHNEALALYRAYHGRALKQAAQARQGGARDGLLAALVVDGFGCHFLTDLFASGHIRVPRRVLADRFGIARGALIMSKTMHDEDNHLGLWCHARVPPAGTPRVVWRAYGDGALASPDAQAHLQRVQEAVRVSVAEVFAAFASATPAQVGSAADLVPVPLPPGQTPAIDDVLPSGDAAPRVRPNHYPLFTLGPDGRVWKRQKALDRNAYDCLEGGGAVPLPDRVTA